MKLSFIAKNTKDVKEKETLDNQVKEILTNLKKEALQKFKDESDIKKFLDNIINFNNYSFNNMCLIHLQNPDSKYVASFKTFSKMGYYPKKDEKSIKILIPSFLTYVKISEKENVTIKPLFTLTDEELKKYKNKDDNSVEFYNQKLTHFKVGSVFDISQTNMPVELIEELEPTIEDPSSDQITDAFIKTIYKDGFKVKYENLTSDMKGYCDHNNDTIVIRKGLSNLMGLKVIIHEYAHALAHQHLKNNGKEYREHRNQYESEAEAIAYVVTKSLGLNSNNYSLNYLYSWSKNKDFKEIEDSFSTIVNYSKKIINNFEKFYDREININDKQVLKM